MKQSSSSIAEKRLKEAGISPTSVRKLVYNCLEEAQNPISLIEIENLLETVDRSSISRALNIFKKYDLVHFFNDFSGSLKYELCPSHNHSAGDFHPHFYCVNCAQTICLEDIKTPLIELPEGYEMKEINYVISGICKKCSDIQK